MKSVRRLKLRTIGSLVVLTGLSLWIGCSSQSQQKDMGGADGSAVASLVEDLNEVKHNPKKLSTFFASKNAASAKEMNKYAFYVKGKPIVDGAKAVCNIFVESVDGTPVGEKEWEFEKVADGWKIKSAPIR